MQQAFPELPVVLDPLRQARERRDAYLAGKADGDAVPGLAALLHGAGEAMPFLAGRLQRLDYHAGELDLELLPGPPGGDAAAWQGELGKHGLQADASDKGWQVRAMEAPPAPLARQTVALPRRLPMKMNKRLAGLLNTRRSAGVPCCCGCRPTGGNWRRASARFSPAVAWRYAWR